MTEKNFVRPKMSRMCLFFCSGKYSIKSYFPKTKSLNLYLLVSLPASLPQQTMPNSPACRAGKDPPESTSAPCVILVINVNISLVGLILLSSIFQMSSTMEWCGQEDVEPLKDAKDRRLVKAQKLKTLLFHFSDPRSH